MKKILTALLFFAWATLASAQTIRVANNNHNAPDGAHVYELLQDAIDASDDGDIIHVIPSDSSYGRINVRNRLTIIGIGYNPDTDRNFQSRVESASLGSFGASGTKLIGLTFDTSTSAARNLTLGEVENIRIEKCHFVRNSVWPSISSGDERNSRRVRDIVVQNCIIEGNILLHNTETTDVVFLNNIFISNWVYIGGFSIISNNIFVARENSSQHLGIRKLANSIVTNNIFYDSGIENRGNITNNIFSHNLTFKVDRGFEFPSTDGNTEANNIVDQNPQFFAFSSSGAERYSTGYDFRLRDSSPGKNAGNDGRDIGVYGGQFPFDNTGTSLPVIRTLNTPGLVNQGSDLQVEIKAQAH